MKKNFIETKTFVTTNFITVNWSAEETNPWTSKLEIIKIAVHHIVCKCNDSRLKTEDDGNIWIPIEKGQFNEWHNGTFHFELTNPILHGIYAWIEYDEIENLIKENNWKIGSYDMHPVIIDEKFDENMTVKDTFYKSNVIGRMITRYEDDLNKVKAANMKLKDAKKIKYDTDEYWEMFGNCDSAVRWMIGFMLKYLV